MSTIIFFACWRWWLKNIIPTRYVPKTGLVSQSDKNVFMFFSKENWIPQILHMVETLLTNRAETYRNVQVFWFDKRYKAWTRTIRLMTIIFSIAKEMWFSYVNRTSNRTHYIFLFIIMLISLLSVCLRLSCSLYLMRKCWFGCWWFLCNLSWLQDYEVILDISLNLLII